MKFYRAQDDITVGSANLSFYLFYFVNSPKMGQILSRIKAEIAGTAHLGAFGGIQAGITYDWLPEKTMVLPAYVGALDPERQRQTALITGASSGIGLDLARLIAPKFNLIITARNQGDL